MKKYLYLLIACTMMCFAGCEEKGDEIDNTTDTGESVEINEANLVGTWEFVSIVDSAFSKEQPLYIFEYDSDKEKWRQYGTNGTDDVFFSRDNYNLSLTLNADKTYSANLVELADVQGGSVNTYIEEEGNWSVSNEGTLTLSFQNNYKKETEKESGTVKEYNTTRADWLKFFSDDVTAEEVKDIDIGIFCYGEVYVDFLYEEYLKQYNSYVEEWGIQERNTSSITELTDTRLVIELKMSEETRKFFKSSDEVGGRFSVTLTLKKVK